MQTPGSSSWLILAFAAALLYRTLLSALMEAFRAVPAIHRRRMMEEDSGMHPLLGRLLEDPYQLGLGISLWNRLLLVALVGASLLLFPSGSWHGWLLLGATLPLVWILDGLVPVMLTAGDPERWVHRLFPFYAPAHRLMAPLLKPLERILLRLRERQDRLQEEEPPSEQAVTALLEEGEAEGILEAEDRELIRNVMEFGDTVVREVMTPRTLIHAISAEASPEEVWSAFRETRHSRVPVYAGSVDSIIGVLLLKDLMQQDAGAPFHVVNLLKPALFVPESKPVLDLLRELQRARTQLAVVVDEYGSVSGVVTMEDLLEEVFGEIREEHEAPSELVTCPGGDLLVPGSLHVEDLGERLGRAIEREGFDTVAGLVLSRLGHLPQEGEGVAVGELHLEVERMEGSRILQVRVKLPGTAGSSPSAV